MKNYKIYLWGYGGEITIGEVNDELRAEIKAAKGNLTKRITESISTDWNEIDDQLHSFGCHNWELTVDDEEGKEIFRCESRSYTKNPIKIKKFNSQIDQTKNLVACFSEEKGTFFIADLKLEEDFDPDKLELQQRTGIYIKNAHFPNLIFSINYDGEELNNWGGDTSGKAFTAYKNFKY
jgi:hypothetical protein